MTNSEFKIYQLLKRNTTGDWGTAQQDFALHHKEIKKRYI